MTATPPPIPRFTNIAKVIEAISSTVDWSIGTSSRFGYLAAPYKRTTIAVSKAPSTRCVPRRAADGTVRRRVASRYFDAVNGHFPPDLFPRLTRSWQASFDAAERAQPIMMQHMLGGIDAHILLDLGIIAQQIGSQSAASHRDFDSINALLASQVSVSSQDIDEISPALAYVYAVTQQRQIFVINEAVRTRRNSAWRFGPLLAAEPGFARLATIWVRDRQVSTEAKLSYDPPSFVATLLASVAVGESREVVANLRVLDEIASVELPIATTCKPSTNLDGKSIGNIAPRPSPADTPLIHHIDGRGTETGGRAVRARGVDRRDRRSP